MKKIFDLQPYKNIILWIEKNPVLAIILSGIFFRLLIAAFYQHITVYPDSEDYINLAERLCDLNLEGYEGQRSPGYSILLCLANKSLLITVIFQAALGIASLVYSYKTFRILGINNKMALPLIFFLVCYLPSIFFEFAILTETLTLFCITMCFYTLFKMQNTKQSKIYNYILLSVICGFLVLIKPFYVYLGVILCIILLIRNFRGKLSITKPLLIAILPLFIYFGWSAVNKINTGYFTPTTYYGFNMAQNCVSFAENTSDEYAEIGDVYAKYRQQNDTTNLELAMTIWQAYPELKEKTKLSFPDLSDELYNYSIATIKLNWQAYLQQVGISWIDFWKTSLYWEYDNFSVTNAAPALKLISYAERIALQFIKLLFVLLTPIHLISFVRKRRMTPQLIISLVVLSASLLQALVTYGTNSRFSFPFETLIFISVVLDVFNYKSRLKQES